MTLTFLRAQPPAPDPGSLWLAETANANHKTPMHLRTITDLGPRPGDGVDTPALCGAEVVWDVRPTEPDDLRATWLCYPCRLALWKLP